MKLEGLCEFINGVTFEANDSISQPREGYLPILRAGNIQDKLNIASDLVWVPEARISKDQYIKYGDLIICLSSGSSDVVGKTAIVDGSFKGSVGAFCGIIRSKEIEDQQYLRYWFSSENFLRWRDSKARGINIQNLRLSEFGSIDIPYPSSFTRQRIIKILQKADRLRRLRRYALHLSEGFLQSVFLEMFGDESRFPSVELVELMVEDPKNGLYLPAECYGDGTPIIRIDAFYNGVLNDPKDLKRVRASEHQIREFEIDNDDILINRVNSLEFLGKCALVEGITEHTVFESNMMKIKVNQKKALPSYVVKYLTTDKAYVQIRQRAKEAVNQASINQQDVKSFKIPLPSLELQLSYKIIESKYKKLNRSLLESSRQAEHLFQTLLQRAFRGEL